MNQCAEACKKNFAQTGLLFSHRVCKECKGCIMSEVYDETGGEHPSTVRMYARTDHAMNIATSFTGEPGEQEPS